MMEFCFFSLESVTKIDPWGKGEAHVGGGGGGGVGVRAGDALDLRVFDTPLFILHCFQASLHCLKLLTMHPGVQAEAGRNTTAAACCLSARLFTGETAFFVALHVSTPAFTGSQPF